MTDLGLSDSTLCQQELEERLNSLSKEPVDLRSFNDNNVPAFYSRRLSVEERSRPPKRLVDNEEITLMGIFEEDGKITKHSSITLLIVLLTRISKIEHRVLCEQVLSTCLTKDSAQQFIQYGGLRILKRWVRYAEEEGCIDELRCLVKICKNLPFDGKAVKDTEIGKSMKKLLKYKGGNSAASLQMLYEDVKDLMAHWTALIKMGMYVTAASTAAASAVTSATRKTKEGSSSEDVKPHVKAEDVREGSSTSTASQNIDIVSATDTVNKQHERSKAASNAEAKTVVGVPATSGTTFPRPVVDFSSFKAMAASAAAASSSSSSSSFTDSSAVLANNLNSSLRNNNHSSTGTVPVPVSAVARQRRSTSTDMAEGARKLLALRAQQQQEGLTGVDGAGGDGTGAARSAESIISAKKQSAGSSSSFGLGPGVVRKGGLKRKTADSSSGSSGSSTSAAAKRAKMSITWADEKGGSLREVQYIEVDKIKSSVAEYQKNKSHKELVKKERQLEKDTHLHKVEDAMQRNTDWRIPAPLQFSLQIRDMRDENPLVSDEKEVQSKRLSHVLEVRYLDDSLIPSEPDFAAPESSTFADRGVGGAPIKVGTEEHIPWAAEGGTDDDYVDAVVPDFGSTQQQQQHQLHSYQQQQGQQAESTQLPAAAGNTNVSNNPLLAALPPALHRLNMTLLQSIVQDPSLFRSLLGPDGKVDESRVQMLETMHSNSSMMGNSNSNGYGFGNSNNNNNNNFSSASNSSQSAAPTPAPGYGMFGGHQLGGSQDGGDGAVTAPKKPRRRWGGMAVEEDAVSAAAAAALAAMQQWGNATAASTAPTATTSATVPSAPMISVSSFGQGLGSMGQYGPSSSTNDIYSNTIHNNNSNKGRFLQDNRSNGGGGGGGSKAGVPCRFFNTPRGCNNGDKCPFGHFAAEAGSGSSGGGHEMGRRRFGGASGGTGW